VSDKTTKERHLILSAFAKLRKAIIRFVMFVCPHGTTQLPLHVFSWNLVF